MIEITKTLVQQCYFKYFDYKGVFMFHSVREIKPTRRSVFGLYPFRRQYSLAYESSLKAWFYCIARIWQICHWSYCPAHQDPLCCLSKVAESGECWSKSNRNLNGATIGVLGCWNGRLLTVGLLSGISCFIFMMSHVLK